MMKSSVNTIKDWQEGILFMESRKYQGNNIEGWMMEDEIQWLYSMASESNNILEVGSWKGRSTHALLSGCWGTVYAVDHWLGSLSEWDSTHREAIHGNIFEQFKKNVGHFPNLVTLKMHSKRAAKLFGNKWFDMIFIDGGHDYWEVRSDIEAWFPKCRKLFCGHDLYQGGVKPVLIDLGLAYEAIGIGSLWKVNL